MTTTPPQGLTHIPSGGFGIDSKIGAAALRAPAASREDTRPHAILKLQPCNSFDYRVRYEPQLKPIIYHLSSLKISMLNLSQT